MSASDRRLALRLAALALLLALYPALDWGPLRHAVRGATGRSLHLLGDRTATDAGHLLLVDGGPVLKITPGCTYARLIFAAAPFVWRFRRPLGRNLLRLAVLAAVVSAINLPRLVFAAHFAARGVPWLWAHDVPDLLLHGLIFAATIAAALGDDREEAPGAASGSRAGRAGRPAPLLGA
ncbi:MAG TPA: hypothetical protein VN783_17380 [Thermoanaerobaculia bacterium]|nr:hypothetical protein [Thermoanaerobaculia bacterium]